MEEKASRLQLLKEVGRVVEQFQPFGHIHQVVQDALTGLSREVELHVGRLEQLREEEVFGKGLGLLPGGGGVFGEQLLLLEAQDTARAPGVEFIGIEDGLLPLAAAGHFAILDRIAQDLLGNAQVSAGLGKGQLTVHLTPRRARE